jgi:hypothetical protein
MQLIFDRRSLRCISWRILSLLSVAALGALLGGCFLSEQEKFPLSTAAAPFGDGGRFGMFEHESGDSYKPQEGTLTPKRRTDGAYDFINEKGESTVISLHPAAGDLFVGQSVQSRSDKIAFAYIMFRVAGDEAFLYIPQCDAQDTDKLASAKVDVRGLECWIDPVADPSALFRGVIVGEPVSKMVRQ